MAVIFYAGQIVSADDLNNATEIGQMFVDMTATIDSSTWNSATKVLTNLAAQFTARANAKYEMYAKVGVEQTAAAYATTGLVYKEGGAAAATDTLIDATTTRVAESAIYTETNIGTFTAVASGTVGVAVVGWIALGAATMNLGGSSSNSINRLTVKRVN